MNKFIIGFMVLFMVALPKGGVVSGVPITWGYASLAVFAVLGTLNALGQHSFRVDKNQIYAISTIAPFQIWMLGSFIFLGVADSSVGYVNDKA